MRPPEPDPLPLRVDVINGWPLIYFINYIRPIFTCSRCTAIGGDLVPGVGEGEQNILNFGGQVEKGVCLSLSILDLFQLGVFNV